MKLSIIVPVYNERNTIAKILELVKKVNIENIEKEIIVVDDGSDDGTREILKSLQSEVAHILFHNQNLGKGAAIRTGLSKVTGDYVLIQDADLEYDPEDYIKLLRPVLKGWAEVVYGSRFTGEHRNIFFFHWLGNRFLTFVTNFLYNTTLSDMETGYKLFKTEIIKSLPLRCNRFAFEPEVTAKILKRGIRIYEVPISYVGREYSEGKKIRWTDGIIALICLLWFRFFD